MTSDFHKNLISFFLIFSLITFAICGSVSYLQYQRLSNTYYHLIESYQTIRAANQTIISFDEASMAVSRFLITKESGSLSKIPEYAIAAQINFDALKQLVSDNKTQSDIINTLEPLIKLKLAFLNNVANLYAGGQIDQIMTIIMDKKRLHVTFEITALVAAIKQEETNQLNQHNENLVSHKSGMGILIPILGIISAFLFVCFLVLLNRCLKHHH